MEHLQSLTGLNLLFYIANFLWILEFIVFRNKSRKGRYHDRWSFYGLVLTIGLTIAGSIWLNREGWGNWASFPIYRWFQGVALLFYGLGLFLRYFSSRLLGQHFTRHVNVSDSMELVSSGPYRYLRHPLYLGLFLLTIAFPIYLGNFVAIVFFTPIVFVGLLLRMRSEERALEAHIPAYKTWKKSRYRFIPFIF
jgi:protein-S-isoprenylcysteine O-methyltransferase Ste14